MSQLPNKLSVNKIGIVGSGQIGPDIALHFAKTMAPFGVPVVVVDIAETALERGRAKLGQKVAKGRESGAFSEAEAEQMLAATSFTTDYDALRDASLVIEAATEDLGIKRRIFAALETRCGEDTVIASNSSHLEPDAIFTDLRRPERALVIHYFFPAERNPLVEIVPGRTTDPDLVVRLLSFYETIGKVPIRVGSRYGFAVNPVFEGLFLAAALAVEDGLGTVKEVDAAARRALGLGVGPFTAMNLTGGNPLTDRGLGEYSTRLGRWFRSPRLLRDAVAAGHPWDVAARGESVELPPDRERRIAETMQGAYCGLAGQILDSGIVSLPDLELGLELGLAMRPAFQFMNDLGCARALELVSAYADVHPEFEVPTCLRSQAASARPFRIDHVLRRDEDDVAVLTIRRPRVLNALSGDVYDQLYEHFAAIRDDQRIAAAVLTGFGTKAFVAGADVNFLARMETSEQGTEGSEASKRSGLLMEGLGKPIVCAMNGYAIGGGNELAMCCTARIVRRGLAMAVSQPEVNLGIIPGAGATQRLPRLVGVERAAELLRTGRPLSGAEAVDWGLITEEVDGDVVEAAVALARAAAQGIRPLRPLDPAPLMTPEVLPAVDIRHRSRAIDQLLCRAIVEGCRRPLADGLRLESELFGACCATEDMRIGIRHFLTNGPRTPAPFVHR